MNRDLLQRFSLTILAAALACGASACNKGLKGEEQTEVLETTDGVAIVDTIRMTATVTAIDPASRKVTLTSQDGGKKTYKAAPKTDLSQFKVGDRVTVQATEELAVALRRDGAPPSDGIASAVALATAGNQSGVLMAAAAEVTAKITNIDVKHRKVTLKFADGTSKTIKVGKKIDLSKVAVGNDVVVQVAEALAISLSKA